jgi:hypothetical protein
VISCVPVRLIHLQITDDPQYAWVARGILDYVMRDMTHPEGGIFSAEVPVVPDAAVCAASSHLLRIQNFRGHHLC